MSCGAPFNQVAFAKACAELRSIGHNPTAAALELRSEVIRNLSVDEAPLRLAENESHYSYLDGLLLHYAYPGSWFTLDGEGVVKEHGVFRKSNEDITATGNEGDKGKIAALESRLWTISVATDGLVAEIEDLKNRNQGLKSANKDLRDEVEELRAQNTQLVEQLAGMEKLKFGSGAGSGTCVRGTFYDSGIGTVKGSSSIASTPTGAGKVVDDIHQVPSTVNEANGAKSDEKAEKIDIPVCKESGPTLLRADEHTGTDKVINGLSQQTPEVQYRNDSRDGIADELCTRIEDLELETDSNSIASGAEEGITILKRRNRALAREAKTAKDALVSAHTLITTLSNEKTQLLNTVDDLKACCQNLRSENNRLTQNSEQNEVKLDDLQHTLRNLNNYTACLQGGLDGWKLRAADFKKENDNLKAKVSEMEGRIVQLTENRTKELERMADVIEGVRELVGSGAAGTVGRITLYRKT